MKDGFFTQKQTQSNTRPDGKILSCFSCGLYKTAVSPKMKLFGNGKLKILNIGEAPGEIEDQRGKPWQGKTGRLLQKTYRRLGIDLFEDCWNLNAVNCRPTDKFGNDRAPTTYEINCCRRFVYQAIHQLQPKLIMVFGSSALTSLIGHRWKRDLGGIMKWRGWTIPDQDLNSWICPTFHPSFVERSEQEIETIWIQDIKQALEKLNHSFPYLPDPTIEFIDDPSQLEVKTTLTSFDYETTGLKPHGAGHRIICASLAQNPHHVYAFMMPSSRKERKPFLDYLSNPKIGKQAHNMKFEQNWSVVRLKTPVYGWVWDSLLAAHLLDNRPGVTGLKFQTYVNFGIIDYSSEIDPYLKAKETGGNSFNQIDRLLNLPGGKEMLLKYCALDSIWEYRLASLQQQQMSYSFLPF